MQRFSDVTICFTGDANTAGIGKRLQSGCDVHAVSEEIATSDQHVTDVDADPELKSASLTDRLVRFGEGRLHFCGTLDCIHHARKLGQDTVSRRIRDPASIFFDEPVHHFAMVGQDTEGRDLVRTHES
jgi:hypothetical protein